MASRALAPSTSGCLPLGAPLNQHQPPDLSPLLHADHTLLLAPIHTNRASAQARPDDTDPRATWPSFQPAQMAQSSPGAHSRRLRSVSLRKGEQEHGLAWPTLASSFRCGRLAWHLPRCCYRPREQKRRAGSRIPTGSGANARRVSAVDFHVPILNLARGWSRFGGSGVGGKLASKHLALVGERLLS